MSEFPDYVELVRAVEERGVTKHENTLEAAKPIASWLNDTPWETNDLAEVLALYDCDRSSERPAVCVVEDISWEWIRAMGDAWDIEPHFFAHYGVNPRGDNPHKTLFPESHGLGTMKEASKYYHVDGIFEHQHLAGDPKALASLEDGLRRSVYRRKCWVSDESSYPPSSNTRISYCRVHAYLYLFLVDPPPFPTALDVPKLREPDIKASMQNLRTKTVLRVQCPGTHGINLPQLLERRAYSLRQILHRALQNDWHFYVTCMFQCTNYAIDRGGLLHLTSASLHRSNFIAIDKEIKEISFRELPNPDMRTNTKLLALREVLYELVTGTAETQNYASSYVVKSLDDDSLHSIDSEPVDRLERYSPIERLATITPQASDLQRFLMDSFQLLMSSVSVAETQNAAKQAKLSMEQAERTAKLTQLAFVYIPLTFVTSIFGMNVRELVDPVLPVWVCFVTLVVVAAATAAIFGSYKYRPDNVLRNLLSERYARALGLRGTAVPSQSIDATDTDVEKGPACS